MIRIRIVILHLTGAFRNILANVLLLLPRCSCLCYVIFWWLVSFEIWFVTSLDYIQNKRNTHLFCVGIILRLLSLNSFCSFYWDFTYPMYLSTLLLLIQCIVKYYKNRPIYILERYMKLKMRIIIIFIIYASALQSNILPPYDLYQDWFMIKNIACRRHR